MHIYIAVVYYLPSTKSSAKLIHDLAFEFGRLGHQVTVITVSDVIESDFEITNENGIRVLRVKTGKIDGASKIVRAFNELMISRNIWQNGKKYFESNPCDLIVWYSPTIFFGSLVAKIKKRFSARSYLILRDIFPEWAIDAGILKKGIVSRFFQIKALEQYNTADIIGVQSPANLEHFQKNYLSDRIKIEVLYNWTSSVEKGIPNSSYREKFGLKDKVVFFYGGNIGLAQDFDNIIRLAENVRNENRAFFLVVGEGSESERLKKIIVVKNLQNIRICEPVSQKEYLAMLSEFDVGMISLDKKLQTHNFPGKMLGYMYFSMPVLASINQGNDLKFLLEEENAGLVSINGDDHLFKENALKLVNDIQTRRDLGGNAKILLEKKFEVNKAASQILSHF